jgi:hypothetical protein
MTLERYAGMVAHVAYFRGRADQAVVLGRLGVTAESWAAAAAGWPGALADEAIDERTALSDRFGTTFVETRRWLDEVRPSIESLQPLEHPAPRLAAAAEQRSSPSAPPRAAIATPQIEERPAAPRVSQRGEPSRGFSPWAPPASVEETAAVPILRAEPTLPFVAASPEHLARMTVSTPTTTPAQSGETVEAPVYRDEPPDPTLPFLRVVPLESSWTVGNYASLCAELATFPEHRAHVLARYGIRDEGARRALNAEWAGRMAQSPGARDVFEELYASYRDFLLAELARNR